MAIAVVQHASGKDGAATTNPALAVTISATGAGNLLVVAILLFNASPRRTVASVVDSNGNSFTHFTGGERQITTGPYAGVTYDIWYLPSSTAGATSVTVTASGQPITFKEFAVYEVSGFSAVATDGVVFNENKASVGTTFTGEALLTTGALGFVAAFAADVNPTQNPKTGNAFTAGSESFGGGSDVACALNSSAAATYTPEWVGTANPNFSTFTFALKDSSGGPTTAQVLPAFLQSLSGNVIGRVDA